MNLQEINEQYQKMQSLYGDPDFDSILNGGKLTDPDLCLIFMNPTSKNVAANKNWRGLKSPWIGTKRIWQVLNNLKLIDDVILDEIKSKKPQEWDEDFALKVYDHVKDKNIYITNLGKCTQLDARPLKDEVFKEYLSLLDKEIEIINPKKIICFGNQVSSLFLNQKIKVSEVRKQKFLKSINGKDYEVYSVYYPIGNGSFNIDKVIEDMSVILKI